MRMRMGRDAVRWEMCVVSDDGRRRLAGEGESKLMVRGSREGWLVSVKWCGVCAPS
jgi:hypothetical protein